MPLELRDILMIAGVLIVIVLIFDGVRRMRNASPRYQQKKYTKEKIDVNEAGFNAELPNGGARLVSKDLDLQEDVPVLVESFAQQEQQLQQDLADEQLQLHVETEQDDEIIDDILLQDDLEADLAISEALKQQTADIDSPEEQSIVTTQEVPMHDDDSTKKEKLEAQQVLVINVMANDEQGFAGEPLLELLLACGLRFGEMNIFHRYDDQEQSQFSLVNAVQPGVFDLDKMHHFSTPGVALFMQLPCQSDALQAFDFMYETAVCLAKNLNGQLKDEQQSSLTAQTAEHYRDKIRTFKQSQLTQES